MLIRVLIVLLALVCAAPVLAQPVGEEAARIQLEKTRLEVRKLENEVKAQEGWYRGIVDFVPLGSALLAIGGFLLAGHRYVREQEQNREAQAERLRSQKETAEREFMKPWLESQRQIYQETLIAAAKLANSRDPALREQAEQEFWQLFHGKMVLVETQAVAEAMRKIGDCLDGLPRCDNETLNGRVNQLATVMAESMASTARMTFEQFRENQFQYTDAPD